jgi:hypothetical protein
MLCINAEYPNTVLNDIISSGNGRDPLICTYNLAYYFGVTFFTIALFLNSARWIYLIIFEQKGIVLSNLKSASLKGGIMVLIIVLSVASCLRMVEECTDHLANANGINKANIFFGTIV